MSYSGPCGAARGHADAEGLRAERVAGECHGCRAVDGRGRDELRVCGAEEGGGAEAAQEEPTSHDDG